MADHTQMVLPWLGGAHVYGYGRAWKCRQTPHHPGWYAFHRSPSRHTTLAAPNEASANLDALDGFPTRKGYLVADRFIAAEAPIRAGVSLLHQTRLVFCLEPGSDWLQPAVVAEDPQGRLIFTRWSGH